MSGPGGRDERGGDRGRGRAGGAERERERAGGAERERERAGGAEWEGRTEGRTEGAERVPEPFSGRDERDDGATSLPAFVAPPPPESEDDDEHTAERPEAVYVEHVRAFIAVDLPIATARELARTQAELRAAWEKAGEPRVAWVPVENIHLTLKFLGSVPLPAMEAVIDALGVLAAARRPIRARLRGLGAFPNPARPTTLWAGVDDPGGALAALAGAVDARCEDLGFARETREWRGHVTIGRVKERPSPGGHPEVVISPFATREFGDLSIREIVVYRSDISSKGARYTPLGRAPLAAPRER